MSRFSAFGIHLGISFIIFLFLAYLVVFEWYPGMFFDNDGGWRGMRIIIGVDLVLGPLLTLIVFKAGKPGLKFDMSAIATLQAVCLAAGTWIVWSEKPVAVVFTDGRFMVMTADDYRQDAGIEVPDLSHFPGDSPKWVMVDMPDDVEREAALRTETFQAGRLVSSLTDRYVPFEPDGADFLTTATDPQIIYEDETWNSRLQAWLADNGGTVDDYAFFTFTTRYSFGYLVYDRDTAAQVGMIMSAV